MTQASPSPMPIFTRPADEGDLNFIRSTWMRAFADSLLAQAVTPSYWTGHLKVRDKILSRSICVVASVIEEPTSICGWVCSEPLLVHFVYVKPPWRRMGIARRLLEPHNGKAVVYTHQTRICHKLPIPTGWIYNPYEVLT